MAISALTCDNKVGREVRQHLDPGLTPSREGLVMQPTRTCSVDGCEKVPRNRQMCWKHYCRMRTYGDPLVTKNNMDAEQRENWETLIGRRVPNRPDEGCWLWAGKMRHGYPVVQLGAEKTAGAHRKSYELAVGPLGDLTVDHTCFVPQCVRPSHLQLLTKTENQKRQKTVVFNQCRSGRHKFTPENTLTLANGRRTCRACRDEKKAAWDAARSLDQ
jgi:hypothetical protein